MLIDTGEGKKVSSRTRLVLTAAIGIAAGLIAYGLHQRAGFWTDYVFPWQAARYLLEGRDPYVALPGGLPEPFETPLLYPLTTVLAAVPFSPFPLPVASAITMGLSAALLTWVLLGIDVDLLWVLASAPFVMAINFGQWSPLVTVAMLVPSLGFLASLKPNLGLAALLAHPSRRAWIGAVIVGLLSVAVLPKWPFEWLRAIRTLPGHPSPIVSGHGAGLLLLAAAFRWRTPEGRLLLIMACVPQLLLFADQLPLMLIARTKRERRILVGSSLLAFMLWFVSLSPGEYYVPAAQPFVLWLIYMPALAIILLRPNEKRVSTNSSSGAANSA